MQPRLCLVILSVPIAGLVLLAVHDTDVSSADTGIPDGKVTTSQNAATSSSVSPGITITMYAMVGDQLNESEY